MEFETTNDTALTTSLCGLTKGSLQIEEKEDFNKKEMKKNQTDLQTDKRRSDKWVMMVRKIQLGQTVKEKDLKRRARKGIPDACRGSAWPTLAYSTDSIPAEYSKNFKGKQEWMKKLLDKRLSRKNLQDIFKDITRTLPQHAYFQKDLGTGQKALFAVLKSLAIQYEECGYV